MTQSPNRPITQRPVVQISLDLTTIEEALDHARKAVRAGVDWLEAGTPLILAEGLRAVRELRREFPHHPVVADLKTMDGGYLEAEMMARAGATHVVVMARAHPATIKVVVKAGKDYGIQVMGDDLGEKPSGARGRSGWWWSTAAVFLWETTFTLHPRRKSSSRKRRLRRSG